MRAAVLKGARSVVVEDRPEPQILADQAMVRVRAAGICGSDLHGFEGRWPDKRALGLIMGHENCGEVVSVGSAVTRFRKGDRVAIDPQLSCGICIECLQGASNLCRNMKLIGSSSRGIRHGGFAEYVAMPERNLHELPSNLSFEEGTLFDPLGNAIHLINRAGVRIGDRFAIIGAGTLGLCLLLAAKYSGAGMVLITDVSAFRLKIAESLGAEVCINPKEEDPVRKILETTDGHGVDIAVEAVGTAETYAQCLSVVKRGGKLMALGNTAPEISAALFRLVSWEISIVGCTGFTPSELERSLVLMSSGKIVVKPLITHRFPLEHAQAAFETVCLQENRAIKVILLPAG